MSFFCFLLLSTIPITAGAPNSVNTLVMEKDTEVAEKDTELEMLIKEFDTQDSAKFIITHLFKIKARAYSLVEKKALKFGVEGGKKAYSRVFGCKILDSEYVLVYPRYIEDSNVPVAYRIYFTPFKLRKEFANWLRK